MKKIFLASAILLAITGFTQKVNNKLDFRKGQKLQMTLQIKSSTDLGMGTLGVNGTIDRVFDITDVSDGKTVIEHKVKRIRSNYDFPGLGEQEFDSEKEKDMETPAGKALEKLIKNKYTMTLDASGKVIAVKPDDDNAKAREQDQQAEMILSLLSEITEGLDLPKEGDNTIFKILPDREMGKGDSWTDSSMNRKTVYTIVEVSENDIMIMFNEESITKKEQAFGPATMKFDLKDKTEGRLTLDRKTGLLKEKSASTNSEGTMEAMGQSGPISSKTTRSWTIL